MDRYSKVMLTIIATALVYLCVIFTPLPGVSAQTAKRPGDPTGPGETVIVGFRLPKGEEVPVSFLRPVPVAISDTVKITGSVTTERSTGAADRMMIAGWEMNATPQRPGRAQAIQDGTGVPVVVKNP